MRERSPEQRNLRFLEQFQIPAVRTYIFVGLSALVVFYTLMPERSGDTGLKLGALLTIIIAVPGLISRWVISPILVLILVTYLLFDPSFGNLSRYLEGRSPIGPVSRGHNDLYMNDFLLVACILVYMIAHYRVMSFVHKSMPDDPAPRRKGQPEPDIPRRPAKLFGEREFVVLFCVGIGSIFGGALLWEIIQGLESRFRLGGNWGITRSFSRFIVFMWSVGTGVVLVGVVFRYLALIRMSWFEARLIVQDQFWLETRREQERIYRWRAWRGKVNATNSEKGGM
jgi:hypothetical protein